MKRYPEGKYPDPEGKPPDPEGTPRFGKTQITPCSYRKKTTTPRARQENKPQGYQKTEGQRTGDRGQGTENQRRCLAVTGKGNRYRNEATMYRVSDENCHQRRDTKNMDIDTAKIRFKNYLESSGYAASTVECYCVYLGYFLDYLKAVTVMDLKQVTHETIRTYQLLVADMAIAEETKGMRLRPVKRLFGWLLDTHRLLLDPTENIRETNRQNRTVPEVLTVAEMRLLLEQPNLSLRMQIRDRAIMETLYSSGIRLNELVQLTVHDVDLKDKVLHIRKGKGNRQRVVPIGKNAATYLQEYLKNIRPRYARKNKQQRRLFLTDQGKPVTGNSIRTSLFHYKKAAGITKTASPHSFRRSCATHLLQQGADIRYVQKLLGHRHIRTTQIYTRVYPIDLKKTHTRTHPGL
jgi:integrase/recombinase XerD